MALTAAIRSIMIALIAAGLNWVVMTLGVNLDVEALSTTLGTALSVVLAGLVAFVINKLGSKWPWVNQIMSFWRAKSPAVFIPNDKEVVTATATPPGEVTSVTTQNAPEGPHTVAKV